MFLEKEDSPGLSNLSPKTVPSGSVQNLSSKLASLNQSIKDLARKKLRIEFEINRQLKALYGKREELKKLQKSSSYRAKIALENEQLTGIFLSPGPTRKEIDKILQESDQTLKEFGF